MTIGKRNGERTPSARTAEQSAESREKRAQYARQIARSEFGRFYWSEEQNRRLHEAMLRGPNLKKETGPKRNVKGE